MPICLTVRQERATISGIAKDVRNFKICVLYTSTTSMAAGPHQADDLDFLLRDALRSVASAAPGSAHAWGKLRARIERSRAPVNRRPRIMVRGEPPRREWSLDRHLLSLGRVAR